MFFVEKEIEVRYAETDQMGVVYHANYLVWMELGRTEFIRVLGYEYKDMEAAGIMSPVTKVELNYISPARYGQVVTVKTWITKISQFRTIYRTTVTNDLGELCLEASCEVTCVEVETFKLISFKKSLPDLYAKYLEVVYKEK